MTAALLAGLAVYLLFPVARPDARTTGVARHVATRWQALRDRSPTRVRERNERTSGDVIDLVAALTSELRAGRSPGDAWLRLAPAFTVTREVSAGGCADPVTVLHAASTLPGRSGLARVAACWEVAEHSGAGLASALDQVAESLRAERELAREVEGQLAGSRATARLLAALPVLALILGEALGAEPVRTLLGTPAGWACLVGGAGLSLVGRLWVERQVRSVTPWRDP